jgi:hypothetical protein
MSDYLPFPPASYQKHRRRFEPMTRADAERWLAAYNAWAKAWNANEDLPLSTPNWQSGPEWEKGSLCAGWTACMPESVLRLSYRRNGMALDAPSAHIRVRGWRTFQEGFSNFRRQLADSSKIVWAGWQVLR